METKDNKLKQHVLHKLPWLLLLPLGLGLGALANSDPWAVERIYSRTVYPVISGAIGHASSLTGFSVAEFVVFSLVVAIVVFLVCSLIGFIAKGLSPLRLVSFLLSLAVLAGVMLNVFYISWGFNYSRPTLYALMELDVRARTDDELQALCFKLADEANALRKSAPVNADNVFSLNGDYGRYFAAIPEAYKTLAQKHELFSQKVYPAKPVIASVGMSYAGISGIYIPFTAEANVNVDQPALLLISSAAHENAHFLGFAREDEANFIAYLACINSQDAATAYSGIMLALIHCGNKLHESDPEKYTQLASQYSADVLRDIAAYNAYWHSFDGEIEEAFDSLNDNYLKFNRQQNGVKSYGMMVDLLLAYSEKYQ